MRTLHWFRSDLRLSDNTALAVACAADQLVPVFVLDDHILRSTRQGQARLRFLLSCLEHLAGELEKNGMQLIVRRGNPVDEVPEIAKQAHIDLVTWNRDYSPYAKRRDSAVARALGRRGVQARSFKDRTVFEANELHTKAGASYSVYTPYRRRWWECFATAAPALQPSHKLPPAVAGLVTEGIPSAEMLACGNDRTAIPKGGEASARERLTNFLDGPGRAYAIERDSPGLDGTSRLSPYLRFGVISVRECIRMARAAAKNDPHLRDGVTKWLDELIWREFYHGILDAFPHVATNAFRPAYDAIDWRNDLTEFEAWCRGQTGFPFIDAAMRQLNATGWMHNRGRMVVASFLTKDLLIDWRWGERYFMNRLVDADPASNNGGWQWAASTGTDAQPYFRIFNPVSQSERFDAAGDYIRRWVPELTGLSGKLIHRPWEAPLAAPGYPPPIVDHNVRRKLALLRYDAVRNRKR